MNTSGIMALKSQKEILSIATSYFQSSILFALYNLKIFEFIGEGSKTCSEIAAFVNTSPKTLKRLLNAGVSVNILESDNLENYSLPAASRQVLIPAAGKNFLGHWIHSLGFFQSAVVKLDQAIRTSEPTVDPMIHHGVDPSLTKDFRMAMDDYAALPAKELAAFLDTSSCRSFLDLGCGPGTYAYHFGLRNPELEITMMDLPQIIDYAKSMRDQFNLKNKLHFLGIDAVKDDIPGSYDLVLISNTLQMLGEAKSRELIKKLYDSINPGGSLVIQGQFLEEDPKESQWPLFFDLIMLCTSEAGHNHSVAETSNWLTDAGFESVEHHAMSAFNPCSIVRGYKRRAVAS